VDGSFAAAERKIVLELQLAGFDDWAADLEILGLRSNRAYAAQDEGGQNEAADRACTGFAATKTHFQLLPRLGIKDVGRQPLFAGL
jgi:hypothetical protein